MPPSERNVALGEWVEHPFAVMILAFTSFRMAMAFALLGGASASIADACPSSDEIDELRRQLAKQQAEIGQQQDQIDELRRMLGQQAHMLAAMQSVSPAQGTPSQPSAPAPEASAGAKSPLSVGAGPLTIAPTGYLEYSQVWRSKNVDSGLPTNFAAVPFADTVDGHRRQTLASSAYTRLGLQINGSFSSLRLLGVVETDFIGFQPGNISTTSNAYGLRLRLAFADVQAGKWEFLGGQNWSMLTPGRKGISASPSDLFLTQDVDPNIQSGLVWTRSPQFRSVYRPKPRIALGLSFESGQAYGGGSAGAGAIQVPTALAPDYFGQVELGTGGLSVPNSHLDVIGKVAVDSGSTGHPFHIEFAGLMTQLGFYNPVSGQRFSARGAGGSLNAAAGLVKGLTFLTANYYSDGGGRFIFGEAPGLIIQSNGAPSLIHSMSTLDGLEYQIKSNLRLWSYYGGAYIGRNVAIDPVSGQPVGYGYTGSPDNHNRSIQELTAGFTRTFDIKPGYGALQFIGQYSWIVRHPWYVAPARPRSADVNLLYLTFRYVLPAARR